MLKTAFIYLGILTAASTLMADNLPPKGNLLQNGDFSELNPNGTPKNWQNPHGASVKKEGDIPTLHLKGSYASVSQSIPLAPGWQQLSLSMKMKASDLTVGNETWKNGRLAMTFKNSRGERVGNWPNVFHAEGSTDWIACQRNYDIPKGATRLEVSPANYGASGSIAFQNISFVVSKVYAPLVDLALPAGAPSPWEASQSWKRQSAAREKISINGLWRFLPGNDGTRTVPPEGSGWGWFKVPGIWPAKPDHLLSSPAQEFLLPERTRQETDFATLDQAWYQREINIPAHWTKRKIVINFELIQTHCALFIDGEEVGDVLFPGGEIDITDAVTPGQTHRLSILHTARPLDKASDTFMAAGRVFKAEASLKLKGITGDVYLLSRPESNAMTDTHVITSTQQKTITFDTGFEELEPGSYRLTAEIFKGDHLVKTFQSPLFSAGDTTQNRYQFSGDWQDPLLWDLHSPENIYHAKMTLSNEDNTLVDQQIPFSFGFREFRIEGRDFYLNEKRIHLRAVTTTTISNAADKASLAGASHSCDIIEKYGFNYLITSNYNFNPGSVGYMPGLFQATQRKGILVSFSLPHVKEYNWELDKPGQYQRYQKLTRYLIRSIQNNPSIVTYAMNHNAVGYYGDQNPEKIDGIYAIRNIEETPERKVRYQEQAELAQKIAQDLDPTRWVYHHSSGNLGDIYTLNCYLNWAPRQERSDWLNHWADKGIKPLFFVEWGLPHIASWSSYRGPNFIWRTHAFQRIWDAEYASAITNQRAFEMTPSKEKMQRTENQMWDQNKPHHWGMHLAWLFSKSEHNYLEVQSWYAQENWKAYRMIGLSAILPWDQQGLWNRVNNTPSTDNPHRFKDLQQPGIVADSFNEGSQPLYDRNRAAFEDTSLGKTILRWNKPVIGFIAGNKNHPSARNGNYTAGERIEKQIAVVNDARENVSCDYHWEIAGLNLQGQGRLDVAPGDVGFAAITAKIPSDMKAGTYELKASFQLPGEAPQADSFPLTILQHPARNRGLERKRRIALFDPAGETRTEFEKLEIPFTPVQTTSDLSSYRTLVIGKNALAADNTLLNLSEGTHAMNILVLEQPYEVISNRFGFRANIMGLRNTFVRNASHPALNGVHDAMLQDWRGASTLTTPYLEGLPEYERHDPTWNWNGFQNTRVWRAGNRGNTASVLIEKPVIGNWLPLIDGGFNLQYAPLLEYRDEQGIILFSQMDLSSRTEREPMTALLYENLLSYLDQAQVMPTRKVYYAGNPAGHRLLQKLGVRFSNYRNQALTEKDLLVVGPQATLPHSLPDLVAKGANALALGLNENEISTLMKDSVQAKEQSVFSSTIADFSTPEFAGLSNSDLYWRSPFTIAALQKTTPQSNRALAKVTSGKGTLILSQLAPWMIPYETSPYLRSTYRRNVFLTSRLLANLEATFEPTMVRECFNREVTQTDFLLPNQWVGLEAPHADGQEKGWHLSSFDDASWEPIDVPGAFDVLRPALADYDGHFWYRIQFTIPKELESNTITLNAGVVDDESWIWFNDRYLGEITKQTHPKDYYSVERIYPLNPDDIHFGEKNTLIIRAADIFRKGGIMSPPKLTIPHPALNSYYLQIPEATDDPYRYYRW